MEGLSYEQVVTYLGGEPTGESSQMIRCPAHKDETPSLSVTDKEGVVLFKCFAGWAPKKVLAARQRGPSESTSHPAACVRSEASRDVASASADLLATGVSV